MQIPRGGIAPRRVRSRITPTEVSAVIPTRAGECRDAALGRRPDIARRRTAGHEHDRRAAVAGAVDVEPPAADVDEAPDLRQDTAVAPGADVFVDEGPHQGDG